MKNYYATLEVPVSSDISEIREAYRRLVQENLWNKEVFAELKEAYEVLSTPARRREYDQANFGQTFSSAESNAPRNSATDRRCPLHAGAQCPVLNAPGPLPDVFCPECGFLLAALPPEGFAPVPGEADITAVARLEETGSDRIHRLRPGVNTVGREAADILLTDKTVSRRHAQVEVTEEGRLFVEDLGSTNGTRLFETALPPHDRRPLSDGDSVRFGSVSLVLRLPEAPPALDLMETPGDEAAPPLSAPVPPEEGPIGMAQPGATPMTGEVAREEAVSAQAMAPLARLIGERHGSVVREDPLVPGVTTFGRRAENTIVLRDDPFISGVHAQIIADGETFRLTDLGSTNGTLLNGTRLAPNEPATLQSGDRISFGGLTYRFESIAADHADEMPLSEDL